MKILVTGGAGYIGSITVDELLKKGYQVVVFDNLANGHREAVKGAELIEGDLNDFDFLSEVIAEEKINAVVHFAAYIEMGESMEKPAKYFKNNVCGSLNLINACLQNKVTKFVFSSTAGVYGTPKRIPIEEDDNKSPENPYGESKLMIERFLKWYDKAYSLRSISLRYFNAAGASLDGRLGEAHRPESHLTPRIMKAVLKGQKKFVINGNDYKTADGTCIRDYIHVVDLAEAHIAALKALSEGAKTDFYNCGAGQGFSNKQVFDKVIAVAGAKIKADYGPRRPGDVDQLIASNEKISKQLQWQPKFSDLDTIVKTAWAWHKSHPRGYSS